MTYKTIHDLLDRSPVSFDVAARTRWKGNSSLALQLDHWSNSSWNTSLLVRDQHHTQMNLSSGAGSSNLHVVVEQLRLCRDSQTSVVRHAQKHNVPGLSPP